MNKLHAEMMAQREDTIEECEIFVDIEGLVHGPCKRKDGTKCSTYMIPKAKWRLDHCPLASHWIDETFKKKAKSRVGQQKQKKH